MATDIVAGSNTPLIIERTKRAYHRAPKTKTHKKHEKKMSLVKLSGVGIGEYLTLTSGDGQISTLMSNLSSPTELVRQQILGLTGYDIEAKAWNPDNLTRFYGPVVAMWLLSFVGKKLVGPVKLSRKFKVF